MESERQVFSDIFPEQLPDSQKTETFSYEYYNSWQPCYLSFLVCHCDKNDYDAETERLKKIPMPEAYLIFGAMEFPFPLPAVNRNLKSHHNFMPLTFYRQLSAMGFSNLLYNMQPHDMDVSFGLKSLIEIPADLPGNSDAAVVKPDHRSVMLQGSIYIQTAAAFVVTDRVSKYIPEGAE